MQKFLENEECLRFLKRLMEFRVIQPKTPTERAFAQELIASSIVSRKGRFIELLNQQVHFVKTLSEQFKIFDFTSFALPPGEYSHRTLSALIKDDSKTPLSNIEKSKLKSLGIYIKEDITLYVRVGKGVNLGGDSSSAQIQSLSINVSLPKVSGLRTILSVENKAYFSDVPLNEGELCVWTEGLNVGKVALLLDGLFLQGYDVPFHHIPDLDPRGLQIAEVLKKQINNFHLIIPSNVDDVVKYRKSMIGESGKIPWRQVVVPNHPVYRYLVDSNLWVEQETFITLDRSAFSCVENF